MRLSEYRDGLGIVDEVVSGRADFGTDGATVIAERMKGQPIRLLANYLKRSPLVLLVHPDIFFPGELKGRRVMAEANELFNANFRQMLARFGLSKDDIRLVPHQFSVEPFARGEVDAMTAFSTNEAFLLRKQGVAFNVIDPSDYGVALYDLNLFTAASYAAAHPERTRAFVDATNRGWDYALAHPDELVDLILARYNTQGMTRDHLRFEANQIHSAILPEVYPVGSIDTEQLQLIEDLLIETGVDGERVPVQEMVFDARLPPSALAGGLDLTREERAYRDAHPRLRVGVLAGPSLRHREGRDGHGPLRGAD